MTTFCVFVMLSRTFSVHVEAESREDAEQKAAALNKTQIQEEGMLHEEDAAAIYSRPILPDLPGTAEAIARQFFTIGELTQ